MGKGGRGQGMYHASPSGSAAIMGSFEFLRRAKLPRMAPGRNVN